MGVFAGQTGFHSDESRSGKTPYDGWVPQFLPHGAVMTHPRRSATAYRVPMNLTVALMASLLVLTACSGGDAEPSADPAMLSEVPQTPPPSGPGTYSGEVETGIRITMEVPVDADDPRLAEIEKYRKLAGAPPFTYIVATYDNTKGTADVWTNGGAYVITEDGRSVHVRHIAMQDGVMEKHIIFTHGLPKAAEHEADAYYTAFYDNQKVRPGATETVILATDEAVPSIARVTATLDDWGDEEIVLTKDTQ